MRKREQELTENERPILSRIFKIFGVLTLIGAIFCILVSLPTAIMVGLSSIVYFGIAQVIEFLGKTAQSTERLCAIMETSVRMQSKIIEALLTSTRTPSEKGSVPPPPPTLAKRQPAVYHFAIDGSNQGPFTQVDMKDFKSAGVVANDTPVFRDGENDWRTYQDFQELVQ
jgi:hypothetical protein